MNGACSGWRGLVVLAGVLYGAVAIGMLTGEPSIQSRSDTVGLHINSETERLATAGQIDVNHAQRADLELLPGIGPALAQAIVSDRDRQGSFAEVAGLERVKGIGPKKIASLRGFLCAEPGTPCRR